MAGDAAGAAGFLARRALMRGLTERLTAAGLHVRTQSYQGNPASLDDRIEEIEVTNHALPGRGTFRVCEDGGVSWEYWGSFDSDHGADAIAAMATALLTATDGPENGPPGNGTDDNEHARRDGAAH
jgi:hypothetical protein